MITVLIVGISAGAFSVNGLNNIQKEELKNYFQNFLKLFNNQYVDVNTLFKFSLIENLKIVLLLWILGVSIIGIPLISLVIAIKGFIVGFSIGLLVESLGMNGIFSSIILFIPKEIIIIPCIIALGVNGLIFSLNIIRRKSNKYLLQSNFKMDFIAYCTFSLFFTGFIFLGVLIESYVIPVLVKLYDSFI